MCEEFNAQMYAKERSREYDRRGRIYRVIRSSEPELLVEITPWRT